MLHEKNNMADRKLATKICALPSLAVITRQSPYT